MSKSVCLAAASLPATSVSKAAEPLSDAPASVYVICHDDVIRSGAQSVPEMLRLAPNLEVMQTSTTSAFWLFRAASRSLPARCGCRNWWRA